MRRAAKIDSNQPSIVRRARAHEGVSVAFIHQLGKGLPDLVVGLGGGLINLLWEVKVGNAGLTEDEEKFHREWKGQITIVRSPEQAAEEIAKWQRIARELKGLIE